jgi:hydrogenase maturation protease
MKTDSGILLLGIGNNCRGDDGLGWKFIELVESMGFDFIDHEFRYQLQVEDAALIADYDVVVFVDATYERLSDGFEVRPCIASENAAFTTHAQSPEAILKLTNNLYKKFPKAYILAICGEEWGLETTLSQVAEGNLQAAVSFFTEQFLPIQPSEAAIDW